MIKIILKKDTFQLNETIEGEIYWESLKEVENKILLSLFFLGNESWLRKKPIFMVEQQIIQTVCESGSQRFKFKLPMTPRSVDDNHLLIRWFLEGITLSGPLEGTQCELTIQ